MSGNPSVIIGQQQTVIVEVPVRNTLEIVEKGPKGDRGLRGETGPIGPQGPPGANYLAGYEVQAEANLQPGDHLEFSGASWVNTHKTTLSDGGNF